MPGQFLSKACNSPESQGKVQQLTVMAQRKRDSGSPGSGVRITESPDSARRTAPSSENNNNVSAHQGLQQKIKPFKRLTNLQSVVGSLNSAMVFCTLQKVKYRNSESA